jgi:Domain of unknown function (DUF4874)/Domain of unknown function (DUF4832)
MKVFRLAVAAITAATLLSIPVAQAEQVDGRGGSRVEVLAQPRHVFVGQPFTLSWLSKNATDCTAGGDWSGPEASSGSQTLVPKAQGRLTYSLTCSSESGSGRKVRDSAEIFVARPSLSSDQTFAPNSMTIPTSEGSAYGFCDFWVVTQKPCVAQKNFGYGPARILQVYICLSGEVSVSMCSAQPAVTGPLPDSMLKDIDERLDTYQGTGMRLLLRFTYNFGPIGPGAMDAPADLIAQHIDQVAPIVLRHKDLIFALEAGFIGTWGEWHDSTSGNNNLAAHKVVLDKERQYFSNVFPILVRDAGDLVEYTGTLVPQPDLGMHDDFYASNSTDAATWTPCAPRSGFCVPNYTQEQLQAYGASVAATTLFAGEFGQLYPPLQTCGALDQYSYTYHAQSITLHPDAAVEAELQSEGCLDSFYNKVGTRIELQSVKVIGNASPGGRLYVAATLVNAGYGRVIRRRPVTLALLQDGEVVHEVRIPTDQMDLRTLASSADPTPSEFQLELTLPQTLTPGQVSMALLFHDPAASLFDLPAYALPLNSVDENDNPVFHPATGMNHIATFDISPKDAGNW